MLVGQTKRLTAYFSMYIKFENVIGLEILSGKLLLPTYDKHPNYAKLYGKKMFSSFGQILFRVRFRGLTEKTPF